MKPEHCTLHKKPIITVASGAEYGNKGCYDDRTGASLRKWYKDMGRFADAMDQCDAVPPTRPAQTLEQVCQDKGISKSKAKAACSGEKNEDACQFDYCASGG